MNKGRIIVVEGACDGIGKTTQFKLLEKRLLENGEKVIKHHFPSYDTYQGKPVEKYLQGNFGSVNELSPYFVNGLYAMDRAITWYEKLKEQYEDGGLILLDRYTTSSLLYQAAGIEDIEERKKFIDYVCDFEYNKLGIKQPDVVIFLYAPFDLVAKLRNDRKSNDAELGNYIKGVVDLQTELYKNAQIHTTLNELNESEEY